MVESEQSPHSSTEHVTLAQGNRSESAIGTLALQVEPAAEGGFHTCPDQEVPSIPCVQVALNTLHLARQHAALIVVAATWQGILPRLGTAAKAIRELIQSSPGKKQYVTRSSGLIWRF